MLKLNTQNNNNSEMHWILLSLDEGRIILTCEGDPNHCLEGPRKPVLKRGAPA